MPGCFRKKTTVPYLNNKLGKLDIEKNLDETQYDLLSDELRLKIEELTEFARNYFKNEWNKAKEGK